jgi:hypothetical protein
MTGISKQDQLKRNAPLKEKPFKSTEYLAWFHNQGFGCMVCGNPHIEAHHIKEHSSDHRDDKYILPLCEFHHKFSDHLSPHGSPKKWREAYPLDLQKSIATKIFKVWENETMDTD